MPLIEYIGAKPRKTDNVAGTGAVWLGAGSVQDVPEAAAAVMLRYPTVWRLAEQQAAEPAAEQQPEQPEPATEAAEYRWVLIDDNDKGNAPIVLDTMTAEQLTAFAEEAGIKVDGRVKDLDKRRAAIYEAVTKG